MYNFPAEHPRISKKELNYIQSSLSSATANEKVISLLPQSINPVILSLPLLLLLLLLLTSIFFYNFYLIF